MTHPLQPVTASFVPMVSARAVQSPYPVGPVDRFVTSSPTPTDDVAAEPAPRRDGLLRHLGTGLLLALSLGGVAAGLAGCSPPETSVSQAQLGTPVDATQAIQSPTYRHLQMDPMDKARIDLHRETEDHDGKTQDVDLSPFGVDLGNGLFYDANGNLTFNPYVALKGQPLPQASQVQVESGFSSKTWSRSGSDQTLAGFGSTARLRGDTLERGAFSSTLTRSQDGNAVVVHRGAFQSDWRLEQDGNRTVIHRGALQSDWTITRSGNEVAVDFGPFTSGYTIRLFQNGAEVKSAGFSQDYRIQAGDGFVHVDPSGFSSSIHIKELPGRIAIERGLSSETLTSR